MKTNRQETTRLIGFIGAAMLIAGFVRHWIMEIWGNFNLGLVIAGAVLALVSILLNFRAIAAFFGGRQGRLGANTAILSIAVIAILGILNFLGYRHHKRFDLTAEGINTLSEQTIKIVGNLPKDVKVVRFETASSPEGFRFADLMSEFKYLGKRLSYERVDPQEKPEVAREYAVTRAPDTVVASGGRIEHVQTPDEQSIVNAILKVTRDKLKRVCFTEGHGERATSATEGDGLAVAEGKLKNENYETKTLNLAGANQPLTDCDVVVVAGPKQPLLPPETAALGKYLDGGGKLMLLLDPETDPQVGDLLKPWNVEVGSDFVLDVSAAGQMFGGGPTAPLVMNYGAHPITQNFGRTMTIFPDSRSVKVGAATSSGVNGTSLLTTSDQSWAETELKAGVAPQFDQGKDQKGPVNLGVAATKSVGENKEARMVVIGDSDFATNRANRFQRNGDLFANSINWLVQDEDLISIRPKAAASRTVTMNESQQNMLFWFVVLLMPLAVAGTGGYIWWKRR